MGNVFKVLKSNLPIKLECILDTVKYEDRIKAFSVGDNSENLFPNDPLVRRNLNVYFSKMRK